MKIVAVVLACLFPSLAFATPLYHFTDLGPGFATCINESGTVAGGATAPRGQYQPAVWTNGVLNNLGFVPGDVNGYVQGINNLGQVVGFSEGGGPQNAFVYDGTMHRLPALRELPNARAVSINDAGTIVGFGFIEGPGTGQMMWKPDGSVVALGDGTLYAISNQGTTIGRTSVGTYFVNNNGRLLPLTAPDGFRGLRPSAVNGYDDFVGLMTGLNTQHAFLSRNGNIIDLGTIPGSDWTVSVNDSDQVVISSNADHSPGYIWDQSLSDLRSLVTDAPSNLDSLSPRDINNKGMIVGEFSIGLERHAFLLTPVPEPTCSLLILGLGLLLIRRR